MINIITHPVIVVILIFLTFLGIIRALVYEETTSQKDFEPVEVLIRLMSLDLFYKYVLVNIYNLLVFIGNGFKKNK